MENKPENQEHEQRDQEKKNYSFIREIIKKKPVDKRVLLRKILYLAGASVLAGVIASFVFVWMVPVAERIAGGDVSRVSIPEDEETASSSEAEQSDMESGSAAVTGTPTPEPSPSQDISLQDYRKFYKGAAEFCTQR